MTNVISKQEYDRVVELLNIIVINEICMSCPTTVIKYLIDIGFTDDELIKLVNFNQDTIRKAKREMITESDDIDDEDAYASDYPELESQDDRYEPNPELNEPPAYGDAATSSSTKTHD